MGGGGGGDLVLGFIRAARPSRVPVLQRARVRPYDFSWGPIHTTSTNAPAVCTSSQFFLTQSRALESTYIYSYSRSQYGNFGDSDTQMAISRSYSEISSPLRLLLWV